MDEQGEFIVNIMEVVITFSRVASHTTELTFLALRKPFHLFKKETFLFYLDRQAVLLFIDTDKASHLFERSKF